ncbi:MAG TPA: hypothetical protein VEO95_08955 [Chthoniobacteraceae bacterium]|nr:hypothetical protein [Chthoniobacteraceae bacterium]
MSTVSEIEAALPTLSPEELRRLEAAVHRVQQRQRIAASPAKSNPRLHALDVLQGRLALDARKTEAWIATVKDSRR